MKHDYIFLPLAMLLFLAAPVYSQSWGIGLRLGDPSGLTIKKYLHTGKAYEFNFGRTQYWYHNKDDWYSKHFFDWFEGKNLKYKELTVQGYRSAVPLAFQFHYLIQKPLEKGKKIGATGLDWYYGIGAQMRLNRYYFSYRYKPVGGGDWIYVGEQRVPNLDVGVDAVIGLELKLKGPISLFLDGTLFMEVVNDPFLFWMQAGVGARYRF